VFVVLVLAARHLRLIWSHIILRIWNVHSPS
jgi:hypothetical protein